MLSRDAPFGVLPVGGGGRSPPDATAAATAAAQWWRRVSHGRWRPRPVMLPPVVLSADPARWCAGGGLGPGPRNAPGLARAALLGLAEPARQRCPRRVVIVATVPIAPHVWRVAAGGVAVAPGRWVRRYAAMPDAATLGAWVHEMAHLLLQWPDLPGSPWLMGNGAQRGDGHDPAPPGARLCLAAGWMREVPATAALLAADLAEDEVATLQWGDRRVGISRMADMLVADDLAESGKTLAVVPLPDADTPVLAAVFDRIRLSLRGDPGTRPKEHAALPSRGQRPAWSR